jgi:hypothetical protein
MAGEPIVEELELDISNALTSVDQLGAALDTLASNFGASIADAISGSFANVSLPTLDVGSIVTGLETGGPVLTPTIDEPAVTQQVDDALQQATTPVTPTVDEPAVTQQVDDALQQTQPVPVTADASQALTDVQTALDSVDTTSVGTNLDTAIADALDSPRPPIPVDADIGAARDAIDSLASTQIDVPVNADSAELENVLKGIQDDAEQTPIDLQISGDTTGLAAGLEQVDADLQDTADSLDALGAAANIQPVTQGFNGLNNVLGDTEHAALGAGAAVEGTKIATEAAGGSASSLTGIVGALDGALGTTVAAGAVFVGFLASAADKAAEAQAAQNRFNAVFGTTKDIVENIHVGGLTISFEDLAKQTGTTVADLEQAASKLGLLGQTAGASAPQVAQTTQQLLGLSGALSVSNPAMGDAADVANKLEQGFQRGGRQLAQFGISLSRAQIQQEAFRETGKQTVGDLTQYDLVQAGTTLAVKQFGDTLGTTFATGAQNASVQFRALKTEVDEALVKLATPLLSPIETVLQDIIPFAISAGQLLGNLGGVVLPLLAAAAPLLFPLEGALNLISTGLGGLATAIQALPTPALYALALGVGAIAVAVIGLDTAIGALSGVLDTFALFALYNPVLVGFTVAMIALGAAIKIFGGDTNNVAKDTKDLGSALFDQIGSVTDLENALSKLTDNFAKFVTSSDGLKKDAPAVADALKSAGSNAGALQEALGGNIAQFLKFGKALTDTLPPLDSAGQHALDLYNKTGDLALATASLTPVEQQAVEAHKRLADQLNDLRKGYQDTITAQIEFLQTSGAITQPQLLGFLLEAKNGTITYAQALDQATAAAAANTEQQDHNAITQGETHKQLIGLLNGYTLASGGAESLTSSITALGISQTNAKTIAKDVVDTTQKQADALVAATPAAQQLAAQYAAGSISAGLYAADLLNLGVSVQGLSTAMQDGTKAQSDYNNAVTAAQDATLLSSQAAAVYNQELENGQITSAQAEIAFQSLGVSVKGSEDALKNATTAADAFQAAIKKIPNASTAFDDYAKSVSSDASKITTDMADIAANHKGATDSLLKDTQQLAADTNPQKYIDNLNKQILQTQQFKDTVDKLYSEGFTNLAAFVAQQGPQVGAAVGQALLGDPVKAKIAESTAGLANDYASGLTADLQGKFGELSGAGVQTGEAITNGIITATGAPLVAALNAKLTSAGAALTQDHSLALAAQAAGNEVNTEFAGSLDVLPGVQQRLGVAATYIISGSNPIKGAAGTAAQDAKDNFGNNLNLEQATQAALSKAALVFSPQGRIDLQSEATHAGSLAAIGFKSGITKALDDEQGDIATHAQASVSAALTKAAQQGGKIIDQALASGITSSGALVETSAIQLGRDITTSFQIGTASMRTVITTALAQVSSAIVTDGFIPSASLILGLNATVGLRNGLQFVQVIPPVLSQTAALLVAGGGIPAAALTLGVEATNSFYTGLQLAQAATIATQAAGAALISNNLPGVAYSYGYGIGYSFDVGISAGINANTVFISTAATNAATAAVNAAHNKIANPPFPSAEGQEIGQSFAIGIATGVTAETPAITEASHSLASALVATAKTPVVAAGTSIADSFVQAIGTGFDANHGPVTQASARLVTTFIASLQGLKGAALKAANDSVASLATIDPRVQAATYATLDLENRQYAIQQERLDAVRARQEAQAAAAAGQSQQVKTDLARVAADLQRIQANKLREEQDQRQLAILEAQNKAALSPPRTAPALATLPLVSPFVANPALAPFVAAGAGVGAAGTSGLVQFALTINLADGTQVHATTEPIAVAPSRPGQLQQLVIAEVKAL